MSHLCKAVTPSGMDELRRAFAEFDHNENGTISKEELGRVMKNFDNMVSEAELAQMIKLADKNGEGVINFNEFLCLMESNCTPQTADEEIKGLFNAIDTDNDGYITESEITKMMKSLGEKISKKDVRKMLKTGDKTKDGRISFTEFKMMIEELPK